MNKQIQSIPKNAISYTLVISAVIYVCTSLILLIYDVFIQGFAFEGYVQNSVLSNNLYPINIISLSSPIVLLLSLLVFLFNDIFNYVPILWHWKVFSGEFSWTIFNGFFIITLWVAGPLLNYFLAKKIISTKNLKSHTGLDIVKIIKNSFSLSLKNAGLIIGASILWALTAWIPYLNVGTTIGLLGLIVLMSRGDSVSSKEIFKAHYRKNMGEFFLLISFIIIGTTIGYVFVIIPGIVISIAWSQSIFLLIDKGFSPLEAIKKSNEITYGEKLTIFAGYFLLALILVLSIGLFMMIATWIDNSLILAGLVGLVGYIVSILVTIGCSAYIYGELSKKLK